MAAEDQRERDQMWKRIDSHGQRLSDIEKGLTEVHSRTEEHSRQLSEVNGVTRELSSAVKDLHASMNQVVGGMKSLRWIGIGLGVLIAIVQIAEAIGSIG